MNCKIHPHSSDETAKACWGERLGKRADKRMQNAGVIVYKKYEQVKHSPPLVHVRDGIAVYTFFSGKVK